MSERIVSLMLDEKVYQEAKDYCYKNKIRIKAFIKDAIIAELNKAKKK